MRPSGWLIGGLSICGLWCGLTAARALTDTEKVKIVETITKRPAIQFTLVKGGPDACGKGCDSWIAADGRIDADAAAHLRRVLNQLGKRKLPIYFNSTGGDGNEARVIGRMLRARGMTAGIARTLAANCLPAKTLEECTKLVREKPDTEAILRTDNAICLSACAIAIIGATTREIAPDALLAVHSAFMYFRHPNPKMTERQRDRALDNGAQHWEDEIERYVVGMGIDKEYFKVITATKFEDMHYLTRAEIYDFKIDRREPVETGWHFGYQPVPAVGSAASVNLGVKADGAAAEQKRMTLVVSCSTRLPGGFILTSLQQLPNVSIRPAADLRVSAGGLGVTLTSSSSFLTTYKSDTFEVRQERAARGMIEALMGATVLTVAEQPLATAGARKDASEASTVQYTIPERSTADALKTLVAHCTPAPQAATRTAATSEFPKISATALSVTKGAWSRGYFEQAAIGYAVYTTVAMESKTADASSPADQPKPIVIALSCGYRPKGSYLLSSLQPLPNSSSRPTADMRLSTGVGSGANLYASASFLTSQDGTAFEVRQSGVDRGLVSIWLAAPAIELSVQTRQAGAGERPDAGGAVAPMNLSIANTGAADALKTIVALCESAK